MEDLKESAEQLKAQLNQIKAPIYDLAEDLRSGGEAQIRDELAEFAEQAEQVTVAARRYFSAIEDEAIDHKDPGLPLLSSFESIEQEATELYETAMKAIGAFDAEQS